uniref:Ribonuclease P and MRP subunit p25 n=2 Tax=Latimeria chalumnae TaxID=7897 RepID=H2ZUT5_LATCH
MENFHKVRKTEESSPLPFGDLPSNVVEMRVKEGSKIRNLMGFAMSQMESAETRVIVFSGSGRAVTKTVTCVEIMKRRLGGLHQITRLRYKTIQEVWQSKEKLDGASDNLTVHKNMPSICILLSKDPLDPNEGGYQPPESGYSLWDTLEEDTKEEEEEEEKPGLSPRGIKRGLGSPEKEKKKM